MFTCNKCGKTSDAIRYYAKVTTIGDYYGGNEFEPDAVHGEEEAIEFRCPDCGAFITDDITEAQRLLSVTKMTANEKNKAERSGIRYLYYMQSLPLSTIRQVFPLYSLDEIKEIVDE